jgi:spermidine/putrescine-binding protein
MHTSKSTSFESYANRSQRMPHILNLLALHLTWLFLFLFSSEPSSSQPLDSLPTSLSREKIVLKVLQYEGYFTKNSLEPFVRRMRSEMKTNVEFRFQNIADEKELYDGVRAGVYDIITPGVDIFEDSQFDFFRKGLLYAPLRSDISNWNSLVQEHKSASYLNINNRITAVPFASGAYYIGYDVTLKANPPKKLTDFFKAPWKNEYLISNYPAHIAYLAALAAGVKGDDVFLYDKVIENPNFQSIYRNFVWNRKHIFVAVDTANDLAKGNSGMVFGFALPDAIKRNIHWKLAVPEEGQLGWLDHVALTNGVLSSPLKKKVAEKFLDFAISFEYQRNHVLFFLGSEAVRQDAIEAFLKAPKSKGPEFVHLREYFAKKPQRLYLRPLNVRDRNGFQKLWEDTLREAALQKGQKSLVPR